MSELDPFFESFKGHLEFQALRYQVGQTIWCPGCQQCMDVHDAVGIDALDEAGQLAHTTVLCGWCFEFTYPDRLVPEFSKAPKLALHDGRMMDAEGYVITEADVRQGARLAAFQTLIGNKPMERRGYAVTLRIPDWTSTITGWVYQYEPRRWFVVESEVGAAFDHGTTRPGAIGAAYRSLNKVGEKRYRKKLAQLHRRLEVQEAMAEDKHAD